MASRKRIPRGVPTLIRIHKLADSVANHTASWDDLGELMMYARRGTPISKKIVVNVVRPNRELLRKFIASSAAYVQAMETVLDHITETK